METSPSEVPLEVIATPDGVDIALPARNLGWAHLLGIPLILFGLAFSGFAVFWMTMAIGGLGGSSSFHPARLAFAAFGVPFFFAGLLGPLRIGLAILLGRAEVRIARGRLFSIERIGPYRWKKSRPLDRLRRLTITAAQSSTEKRPAALVRLPGKFRPGAESEWAFNRLSQLTDLCALRAEFDGKAPLLLAIGYSHAVVQALAAELARQSARFSPQPLDVQVLAVPSAPMTGVELVDETQPNDRPIPQPGDSKAIVERRPDGLTITLPAEGFFKGSHGLGCFSILWLVFVILIFGGMTGASLGILPGKITGDAWIIYLLGGIFGGVGIGMLLAALNMGQRRAILDVVGVPGHTLLITQQSLFGLKQQEWKRTQLRCITVAESGTEVNDRRLLQLRIQPVEGKPVNLCTGRQDEELVWLADELSRALHLTDAGET